MRFSKTEWPNANTEEQISILSNKMSFKKKFVEVHYSSDLLIPLWKLLKIASGCGQSNEVLRVINVIFTNNGFWVAILNIKPFKLIFLHTYDLGKGTFYLLCVLFCICMNTCLPVCLFVQGIDTVTQWFRLILILSMCIWIWNE